MSHECPDCGEVCFCGRDIDDCLFNFERDVMNCTHYLICGGEDNDDDSWEYEDEFVEAHQP